ncbi:CoA-transferase family III [Burkholderia sp. YR290]|nr:CoA-transferase family III [Burkholderia sp. YR290]
MTVRPIPNMVNHETNELFFDNLEIPADNLIGEEGKGFKYILDGLNAERTLIAAECIGDGYWFLDKVTAYVKERVVFGRPIGQNQGVQFPIARAFINVEAASLMRYKACEMFDAKQPAGAQANMAKLLAADASWEAANACLQFHGGFGFANEYDVERKFRETRLYQVAPISTNLILSYVAEHLLGYRVHSKEAAMKPLDGVKVITLEHAIAAPFCTRQLADLGARVIKVERPGVGDFARAYDERVNGLASHFVWCNRSKEASLSTSRRHRLKPSWTACSETPTSLCRIWPRRRRALGLSFEALHERYPS